MRTKIIILAIITFLFSCEKNSTFQVPDNRDVTAKFVTDNAIIISNGDCAGDSRTNTFLCLDSVLNDSRCPEGALCFWAGDSEVRFKFVGSDEKSVFFNLHINQVFTNDTIIRSYKFTLMDLYPHPSLEHFPKQNEYRAEILIEEVTR